MEDEQPNSSPPSPSQLQQSTSSSPVASQHPQETQPTPSSTVITKEQRTCNTCSTSNTNLLRCSNCKTTYYCSKSCQKSDWKTHKHNCIKNKLHGAKPLGLPLVCEYLDDTTSSIHKIEYREGPPSDYRYTGKHPNLFRLTVRQTAYWNIIHRDLFKRLLIQCIVDSHPESIPAYVLIEAEYNNTSITANTSQRFPISSITLLPSSSSLLEKAEEVMLNASKMYENGISHLPPDKEKVNIVVVLFIFRLGCLGLPDYIRFVFYDVSEYKPNAFFLGEEEWKGVVMEATRDGLVMGQNGERVVWKDEGRVGEGPEGSRKDVTKK